MELIRNTSSVEQNNILILRKGTHFNSNKVIQCWLILFLLFNSLTMFGILWGTQSQPCAPPEQGHASAHKVGLASDHEKRTFSFFVKAEGPSHPGNKPFPPIRVQELCYHTTVEKYNQTY